MKNGTLFLILAAVAAVFLLRRRGAAQAAPEAPSPVGRALSPVLAAAGAAVAPVMRTFQTTGPTVAPLSTAPLAPKSYQVGGVTYGTGLNQGRIA